MPDKKLTDSEIVKALECCDKHSQNAHYTLTYQGEPLHLLFDNTLDLINRLQAENKNLQERNVILKGLVDTQKTEIERLQEAIDEQDIEISRLYKRIDEAKAEAYKEFAERLKKINQSVAILRTSHIDNLLKELVGEDDG